MRLFVFVGSLLVLALVAALVVPPYVDWNQFKTRFEIQASRVLGQKVSVRGETSATLLPLPSVTFTDVHIGTRANGGALVSAKSFRMNVELAPLLKGDVVIVDMVLDGPVFDIALDNEGKIDWPEGEVIESDELNLPEIDLNEVTLENISIRNGVLRYRDPRFSRNEVFSGINLTASAATLAGPWRGDGELTYGGEKTRLRASTGRFQEDNQIRVKLSVGPQSSAYDFDVEGPVAIAEGKPSFKGIFRVSPVSAQSDEERIAFPRPSVDRALPLKLEAELDMGSGGATIPAFKLDIGSGDDPYVVNGSAQALFAQTPSLQIRAEGQQINVARLEAQAKNEGVTGTSLAERLAGLRDILDRLPPLDFNAEANLFLPAIVWDDTVIREVGLDIRPAEGGQGWTINNLEAQLPGRTELRASGTVTLGANPGYSGDLIVASKQPSGLAAWLGAGEGASVRDLRNAGFSASTKISGSAATFDNLEIIVDGQTLRGSVSRLAAAPGEKAVLAAKLKGDTVNYDQLSALVGLFSGDNSASTLGTHDLNVDLEAERFAGFGTTAQGVIAQMGVKGDSLDVRRLDVRNLQGAEISLKGTLDNWTQQPVGRLVAFFKAEESQGFTDLLRSHLDIPPWFESYFEDQAAFSNTSLALTLEAEEGGYQFSARGEIGGSETDLSISGTDLGKALGSRLLDDDLQGKLVLVNEDSATLMGQIGLPVTQAFAGLAGLEKGAFRLNFDGVPNRGLKTDMALTIREGYFSASGLVATKTNAGEPGLSGVMSVVADAQDFDPFILLTALPIPGYGEGKSGKLSANVKFDRDSYMLEDVRGRIDGAEISGALNIDTARKPRPLVVGKLDLSTLDLGWMVGLVHTDPVGNDEPPEAILSGVDASLEVSAAKVSLPDDLAQFSELTTQLTVRDGDIAMEALKAKWGGGEISGTLSLGQSTTARLVNGKLTVTGAESSDILALAGFPRTARGPVDVMLTFETAGKDKSSMLNQLTGSGTVELADFVLSGVDGDGFTDLLKKADAVADDKLAEAASGLMRDNMLRGETAMLPVRFDFNIGSGVLRANTVTLSGKNTDIVGSGRMELDTLETDIEARVSFDPAGQAVVGATPELSLRLQGLPDQLEPTIDAALFSTYLALRVSERREREFAAQQAEILERQRLQRSARLYDLQEEARRIAAEEAARIEQLKKEQEEQRRREEARRKQEEIERARLEAELKAAQEKALQEAALEAGRRAERQKQIEILRKQAEDAARRLQENFRTPVPGE